MKRKIQFLSILMTMAILLTSMLFAVPAFAEGEEATGWDGTVATAFARGSGTETDPYLISSAAELAYLAKFTAENDTKGKYFKVTALEIDLNNQAWAPIGADSDKPFAGIFDGDGVAIKKLSFDKSSGTYLGLFGVVQSGTVKNVTVEATLTNLTKKTFVGALIGFMDNTVTDGGNLLNCNAHVTFNATSDASGDADVGGAIGKLGATSVVENVNVYGTITIAAAKDNLFVGGIAGRVDGNTGNPTIKNCANYANITNGVTGRSATTFAGGIVGATYQSSAENNTLTLTGCVNYGTVSAVTTGAARVGGFVGDMGRSAATNPDYLIFKNCVNMGEVTAPNTTKDSNKQLGSLVGAAEGINIQVTNCFSTTETIPFGEFFKHSKAQNKCTVNGREATKNTAVTVLSGCYVGGISLETLTGARVRIDTTEDGTSGLRFDSKIAKTVYDAIAGMSGVEVELGTVIAPTENLVAVAAARDKIAALEKESTTAAPTYIKVAAKAGAWVNEQYQSESGENYDGNANYFTGAVGRILETNYNRAYSAVAYLTVTVGDWSFTFYANDGVATDGAMNADRSRTVAYVGYMAHEDGTKTPGMYTDAQMTILKKYADAYNK